MNWRGVQNIKSGICVKKWFNLQAFLFPFIDSLEAFSTPLEAFSDPLEVLIQVQVISISKHETAPCFAQLQCRWHWTGLNLKGDSWPGLYFVWCWLESCLWPAEEAWSRVQVPLHNRRPGGGGKAILAPGHQIEEGNISIEADSNSKTFHTKIFPVRSVKVWILKIVTFHLISSI